MTATKALRTANVFLCLVAFLTFTALLWAAPLKTEVVSPRTFTTKVRGVSTVWRDLAVSGETVVRLAPGVTAAQFQAMLARHGGTVLRTIPHVNMYVVSLPAGITAVQGAAQWSAEAGVLQAGPDRVFHALAVPTDPLYPEQWAPPKMNAPLAWGIETGSANTVIADLDTGIQFSHEDLSGKIWTNAGEIAGNGIDDDGNGYIDDVHGWNFVLGNNDPQPHPTDPIVDAECGHGSHVAGIMGAMTNNGKGIAGQDWNCRLMSVKVLGDDGLGAYDWIASGIMYAVDNGANVINMSIGGGYTSLLDPALQYARSKGVVVVVAAGNDYSEFTDDPYSWDSPVCNDGPNPTVTNWVCGVAATDSNDHKADFSNYDGSSTRTFVDVSAPGVNILSCVYYDPANGFPDKYESWDGTSMATPQVAGLAALVHAAFPSLDPLAIINRIKSTSDNIDALNPVYAGKIGAGRINDARAVGYDFPPGPPRGVMAGDTPNDNGGSITVSWSKSVDDGGGEKDVVKYTVYRADNQTVNGIDQPDDTSWASKATILPGNLLDYIDTPVPNNVKYWYKVSASDSKYEIFAKPVGPASARDDLPPPAPSLVYAADTQNDNGGSISISWPGYTATADFAGFRIYRSTKSFTNPANATMIKDLPGNPDIAYYADTTTVDGTKYYYGITAYDTSGNEDKKVSSVGPVASYPNFTLTVSPGIAMIAIGANTPQTDMAALLGIPQANLKLLRWDPTISAYHSYQTNPTDPFLTVAPGRGYWIAVTSPLTVDLSGLAVTADPFPIALSPGWNLIGNPFLHDVTWGNSMVSYNGTSYSLAQSNTLGITGDFAWTYDTLTGAYRLISATASFGSKTVPEGAGLWFLALHSSSLNFSGVLPAGVAKPTEADITWDIRLIARSGQSADCDNYLGVSTAAASLNNIVSPPRPDGGPELYFVNKGVDGLAAASFVKPADALSWQARVQVAGLTGQDVEIDWPDLSSLPSGLRPVLTDESTGKSVYMRTASSYHFTPSNGETVRDFQITMAKSSVLGVSAMSAHPAGPGVQVAFTLSAPATVTAEVLNLAGRVVQELPAVTANAGPCSVQWTGATRTGTQAPAGEYLIRVTARTADGQEASGLAQARLNR